MNYKKGFIRLIILGILISPVIAYFQTSDELAQLKENYAETTRRVSIAIADPKCTAILNNGNGSNSMTEGMFCFALGFYWKDLGKYQGPPPDFKGIRDVMATEERVSKLEVFLPAMFKIFGFYLFLWASGFGLFFIGKWIFKGFKSQ